ncbi:MAG: hypothetical protein S4CHLAM81_15370 [Chlamydiales bacterium]|nr:hypothetical protein [Chlamydiales bacterium]MCH9636306.1 hypothetical protein [Chlamydiales bacterium]MCH9703971.1 hypothetical protein [Chlamydiota bacterium]
MANAYPTRGPIGSHQVDQILAGQQRMNEGAQAANELLNDRENCITMTACGAIGGLAAGVPTGGGCAPVGCLAGCCVGAVTAEAVKGCCNIL